MPEVGAVVEGNEAKAPFSVDTQSSNFLDSIFNEKKAQEAAENGDLLTVAERFEATMAELKEHFGDRIIHYGKYNGTVEDIVNKCPAAKFYFDKGPEAFIAWVEAEETEPVPDTDDEADKLSKEEAFVESEEDEAKANQSDQQKDGLTDRESAETKVEAQTQVKNEVASVDRSEASISKSNETKPEKQVNSKPDKKEGVALSEKLEKVTEKNNGPSPDKNDQKDIHSEEESQAPVTQVAVESQPEPEQVKVEPELPSAVIDSPVITEKEFEVEANKDVLSEVELTPQAVVEGVLESSEDITPEEYVVVAPLELTEDQPVQVLQPDVDLIDEVLLNEDAEQPHDNQVAEQFENWQDLAKEEPLLDELFITMSEQLDTELFIEDDSEDALKIEDDVQLTDEATNIEYAFEAFQKAEILQDFEAQEIFDALISEQASTELVALFKAVKASKKSVEKLYNARTKEECAQYLNEIILELTQILKALGYKYPEQYVRDFLSGHSIEALRSLINELEKSLRHAMYREVRLKQQYQAKHRQTRLGKFVNYIMQAVGSRLFASQTTN